MSYYPKQIPRKRSRQKDYRIKLQCNSIVNRLLGIPIKISKSETLQQDDLLFQKMHRALKWRNGANISKTILKLFNSLHGLRKTR